MYAIVECKGFQYRVEPDQLLQIPLTDADPGAKLTLDRVLLIGGLAGGDSTKVGAPTVAGATVEAEVIRHGRGKKIIVGKFKKRKDYRRKKGHRQDFTEIKIAAIKA
ncbi:MAG: 50S ribosomal protein L21 [Candidatus Eisenbacteria bacterium]